MQHCFDCVINMLPLRKFIYADVHHTINYYMYNANLNKNKYKITIIIVVLKHIS